VAGCFQVGGTVFARAESTVVGVETDLKVLSLQWFRQGKPITDAVRGVYRCTYLDIGCVLAVVVRLGAESFEAKSENISNGEVLNVRRVFKNMSDEEYKPIEEIKLVNGTMVVGSHEINITNVDTFGSTGVQVDGNRFHCETATDRDVFLASCLHFSFPYMYPCVWDTLGFEYKKKEFHDLYTLGGFQERYDVELQLEEGEGLGMTLSLFNISDVPKLLKGANVVCVTGFCPLLDGTGRGQLERSGRIRLGDALVAVNDVQVEPKSSENYIPCNLTHVAELFKNQRKLKITFACGATFHGSVNNLKGEISNYKKQVLELKAHQDSMNNSVEEANAIREEVVYLKDRISQIKVQAMDAQRFFERQQTEAAQVLLRMTAERDSGLNRIQVLENSMAGIADDGQAWVNTIGTKDDALRALETDLRKMKMKNQNLEALIDEFSSEANEFRTKTDISNDQIRQLTLQLSERDHLVENANEQADQLTAKLRLENEQFSSQIDRIQHRNVQIEGELNQLKDQLKLSQSHSSSLVESNNELMSLLDREKQNKFIDTSSSYEVESLRGQVKSLKGRIQSLTGEMARVAELDHAIAEKNDILVQLQLEKASRLEAEDELSAYKRALRQFAEQSKKENTTWNRRPKIFDHLYKTLLAEDKQ